jgi:hypothetical protein
MTRNGHTGHAMPERVIALLTFKKITMSRIGKKILSAFVETTDTKKEQSPENGPGPGNNGTLNGNGGNDSRTGNGAPATDAPEPRPSASSANPRFVEYFDKLFSEANIPGPDYYEFSRMIGAMQAIPDEQARFYAAYAGLQVQGLDKEKLLSTAGEYLRMLAADAGHFQATVDTALQEKVQRRTAEAQEKTERIRALSQEILDLQTQITALQQEIGENKQKIEASSGGYAAESDARKARIEADMEKIRHYIH